MYPELRTVPILGGTSTLVVALDDGLEDSGDGSFSPDGSRLTFLGSASLAAVFRPQQAIAGLVGYSSIRTAPTGAS